MLRKLKQFFIFLLLFGSLFFFIPLDNVECSWQKSFKEQIFFGMVIRKYIDSADHSIPKIVIRNLKENSLDTLYLYGDQSKIYYKIKEFDTIKKKYLEREIYVFRNGLIKTLGEVDYGCKDNGN